MVVGLVLILRLLYGIHLHPWLAVLCYLYAVPFFLYLIDVHLLLRADGQRTVALVTALCVMLHLALCLVLVPRFGFAGGLLAGCLSQWGCLLCYRVALRRST
jgi:O-antigen/teichoic acid export membrane protein